jgi:hypothetical protein
MLSLCSKTLSSLAIERAVILAERPLGTIRVVCVNGNKDDRVSGLIVELVWAGCRVIASL